MTTITLHKKDSPRVLVLEDDPKRIEWFKRSLIGVVADFAQNVEDAKELYKRHCYTVMFLDHDLGGKVYVDTKEKNTGSEFCWFLKRLDNFYGAVVLHSLNEVGAKTMLHLLDYRAMIAPFGTFKIVIE